MSLVTQLQAAFQAVADQFNSLKIAIINTDDNPGATLYVGETAPESHSPPYTRLVGDLWVKPSELASNAPPTVTSYCPTTQTILSRSLNTFGDVDATNAKWDFTAPASGKVLLSAEAWADLTPGATPAGDRYIWGIHDGTADVAASGQSVHRLISTTIGEQGRVGMQWLVQGLTPGASYSYKLRHRVDDASGQLTGRILVGTKDSATVVYWGALVMTMTPL